MSAECGTRNAERPHYANATLARKELNAERGARSAERLCSAKLRKQGKIILVRNAERGVRNDFAPLSYANKEIIILLSL